jgi:glycosyltransferase involved in cell wall biosynthesis
MRKKILFLGETYRADAITWMNGLREFGPFDIITWELTSSSKGIKKIFRALEMFYRLTELKKIIKKEKPDLIIAERTTSYGFIASLFHNYAPIAIAQQGITDIYPLHSWISPFKKEMQHFAFRRASLVHAWGKIMTISILESNISVNKLLVLAKGIDLRKFLFSPSIRDVKIRAIVTRSLSVDYRHEIILSAFEKIKKLEIPFELIIVGDGPLRNNLIQSVKDKNIEKEVIFEGKIPNHLLPKYLGDSDLYISMPNTEGVSASLFEAMASGCYPIVSDLPGNRSWINDNVNGRLIPVDDIEGLTDAIALYYENRMGLEEVLVENRHMIESKVSFEKNMKIISDKYLEIINQPKPCAE